MHTGPMAKLRVSKASIAQPEVQVGVLQYPDASNAEGGVESI